MHILMAQSVTLCYECQSDFTTWDPLHALNFDKRTVAGMILESTTLALVTYEFDCVIFYLIDL